MQENNQDPLVGGTVKEVTSSSSRVFRKNYAPSGSMWLIVTIVDQYGGKYQKAELVTYKFLDDVEAVTELVNKVKNDCVKRFKL